MKAVNGEVSVTQHQNIVKLGALLHQARAAKRLSARELSEQVGIHHTTITMFERAQIEQPRAEKLTRLAAALELDATDLLTLAGYQPSDKLPGFGVYLRTTTALPDTAIAELDGHYQYLRERYGATTAGPAPGEDEREEDNTPPSNNKLKGGRP